MMLRIYATLLLLISSSVVACEFESVTFHRDFSGAALESCEQKGKFEYDLWVKPEDTPINNSAWYAFKVSAKTPQTVYINLKYRWEGYHRYPPKISYDGSNWQLLAYEPKMAKIDDREREISAHFKLAVGEKPVWVSAQEVIDLEGYDAKIASWVESGQLNKYQISESVKKRPIWAVESNAETNNWLVLIGRQHPPEVTGALAMLPFVDTVLSNLSIAKQFREQYNILIVPVVNPDGVELGHWRHNLGSKDLNRDWAERSQPETRGIHNRLQEIVADGGKIVFAVDFHSTWKNLFYTMPTDYKNIENPDFSETWLANLGKLLPTFEVDERPGVSRNPGVFKQYIADTYNVHSVTYEVGDHADRNEIAVVAKSSAMLLMKQMLD